MFWLDHPHISFHSYEELITRPHKALVRVLTAAGFTDWSHEDIDRAVELYPPYSDGFLKSVKSGFFNPSEIKSMAQELLFGPVGTEDRLEPLRCSQFK